MGMVVAPARFSSGGGGGGGPAFRASGMVPVATSTTSQIVTFPVAATVGDFMVIFATHGFPVNIPSGWTNINQPGGGSNCNGATFGRTLDAGDISTGSVTVTFTGSYFGMIGYVVFIGGVTGVRTTQAARSGGAGGTRTLTTDSTPAIGDVAIYWAGDRLGFAITNDSGSAVDHAESSIFSGLITAETLAAAGALTCNWDYHGGDFGDYAIILVIQP